MADALSGETRDRIDELCRKISVAHTLDAEIQEELRGHMEDQLLAYLSEQESITEDDAFVLVREHFGDPAKLKAQLQNVHIIDTHVSLARRLAAIVAVHIGFLVAIAFLESITWSVTMWFRITSGATSINASPYFILNAFAILIETLVLWRILLRWERRIRDGKQPWFYRWSGVSVAVLLGAFLCLYSMAPMPRGSYGEVLMPLPAPVAFNAVSVTIVLISIVLHAIIWLWWCDCPPRRPRTVAYAALAWLVLSVLPMQTGKYVQLELLTFDHLATNAGALDGLVLWEEPIGEISVAWALRTGFSVGCPKLLDRFYTLITCVLLLSLAKIIYSNLVRRWPPADRGSPEATT